MVGADLGYLTSNNGTSEIYENRGFGPGSAIQKPIRPQFNVSLRQQWSTASSKVRSPSKSVSQYRHRIGTFASKV